MTSRKVTWHGKGHLKSRAVDNLHVNGQLTAFILDNQDANRSTTRVKGLGEAGVKAGLVKNWKGLLDVTSLSHGSDGTIADIKNAVLLEDWAQHSLNNDGRRWVQDSGRFLLELAGEEVNTQVAVLTSCCGGGNLDDLTWTALEDQQVTNADMVSRDSDSLGGPVIIAWAEWGHLVMAVMDWVSNVFRYVLSYVFSSVSKLFSGVRDLVNGVFGCVSN